MNVTMWLVPLATIATQLTTMSSEVGDLEIAGSSKKRVGVFPAAELYARQRTFDSLAALVPVRFEPSDEHCAADLDACIFLGEAPAAMPNSVPCYIWERNPAEFTSEASRVEFSDWPGLHHALRRRTLTEKSVREISSCSVGDGETVVASVNGHPVWTVRHLVHRVTAEPPALGPNELLLSHLEPEHWLAVLPLLQFLRTVTRDIDWQPQPLKACFIFDDPNIHASTYGYVNFDQIARDAKARHYHVSMATVPMDAWYAHPETSRLFREQREYISLTVHGAEHTKNELAAGDGNREPLLAAALRRIEKLEGKTHLPVSRVMVAPHGACSESTMAAMLKLGFEGTLIPSYSLFRWNPMRHWPLNFGLTNVLWMASGFPVAYRWGFGSPDTQENVSLAAFLGQPLIFYGHHWDCRPGIEILGRVADLVNRCGATWGDLQSVLRANYRTRIVGDLLQVEMGARHISVRIPGNIKRISIHRPWMREADLEQLSVTLGDGSQRLLCGGMSEPIEVVPGSHVTVYAPPKATIDYRQVDGPGVKLWPVLRRALAEARDRLRPIVGV